MIKLNNVTKRYREFTAVDESNLSVDAGEIVGIIGHNGAGKSATLKMMAGLIAPRPASSR